MSSLYWAVKRVRTHLSMSQPSFKLAQLKLLKLPQKFSANYIRYAHSFVVLSLVLFMLSMSVHIWYIYPYSSWLLHWHWGNPFIISTHTKHNQEQSMWIFLWLSVMYKHCRLRIFYFDNQNMDKVISNFKKQKLPLKVLMMWFIQTLLKETKQKKSDSKISKISMLVLR